MEGDQTCEGSKISLRGTGFHEHVWGAIAPVVSSYCRGGIFKKCVNSQAVYPPSEQHGLEAQERRYTAHEEGKHWE